jgi:4-hydroxy-3-polyprenylbenzoate decarboxylase
MLPIGILIMGRFLICVTGASGSIYALRTIKALLGLGHDVHCVVSYWGGRVIQAESGRVFQSWAGEYGLPAESVYDPGDLCAPPSSGSFRLDGTVIVPCSMNTAGAIASGLSSNLIQRSAQVSLKEGRPLLVVPRETPLSLPDLRNLTALAEAGAAIIPASPAFYHHPRTIDDLAGFMAGKILDRLGLENNLFARWGEYK